MPFGSAASNWLGDTKVDRIIEVPVHRLDEWATAERLEEPILLKLDVQGYEARALRGTEGLLPRVRTAIVETNHARLYEGQPSLGLICSLLEPYGLYYTEAIGIIRDPGNGLPAWQDSVFQRP